MLNHNGVLARDPSSRIRTLFVDLAASDIQDPIYLVCRIVRNGALKIGNNMGVTHDRARRGSETSNRDILSPTPTSGWTDNSPLTPTTASRVNGFGEQAQFRRPFGCAVLELTQLNKMVIDQVDVSPLKEYTMPIFIPTNEISFSMIHQNIISNNTKEFEKSPRCVFTDHPPSIHFTKNLMTGPRHWQCL